MDRLGDTLKAAYKTEPYQAAAAALSSFQPLSNVRQHLCGLRESLLFACLRGARYMGWVVIGLDWSGWECADLFAIVSRSNGRTVDTYA